MNMLPKRKSVRLKHYDYSQNGAYFITICTQGRLKLFGDVVECDTGSAGADLVSARMSFSDNYIVIPNHFHCILSIRRAETSSAPTGCTGAAPAGIDSVVQAFKSRTTFEYVKGVKSGAYPVFDKRIWQRNYHEHIVRSENEYQKIWNYINDNPTRWKDDRYYWP